MADDQLKDLVFSTNSTLIETLNKLEVIEIATINNQVIENTEEIEGLQTETLQLKQQLDTLGITVFNYQADTNAHFVTVDNQISSLTEAVNKLEDQTHRIDLLEIQVDEQRVQLDKNTEDVRVLSLAVTDLGNIVETLDGKVTDLQNELTTQIDYLQRQINFNRGKSDDEYVELRKEMDTVNEGGLYNTYVAVANYQFGTSACPYLEDIFETGNKGYQMFMVDVVGRYGQVGATGDPWSFTRNGESIDGMPILFNVDPHKCVTRSKNNENDHKSSTDD
jgi:predicted  nucleic acid-binding Zn-ribbon protein